VNPSNSEAKFVAGSKEENNYELHSVSIQDRIPSYVHWPVGMANWYRSRWGG